MLMLKISKIVIAASVILTSLTSNASEEVTFHKIYTECGLGGLIGGDMKNRETGRVVAVSTNITWDLGTTASTSAFTNDDTCYNKRSRIASFLNQSYEKLEKELAQGEGKYLDALTSLALEGDASKAEYVANLRSQFAKVVSDEGYSKLARYEKVEKLYAITL